MRLNFVKINLLLSMSLVTLLTACDSNSNRIQTDYSLNSIVQLDERQNINQSIDLLLHFPYDTVSNIRWQQLTGEPVTLLAKTSKVISFTPTSAGSYSFSVSFTLNDNLTQTLEKNITVSDDYHAITARLSHTALTGNKVSFRTEIQLSIDASTLIWQQIEGPSVTLTTDNSKGALTIFFDAPKVSFDTIIAFNVSATDANTNITYHDQVAVLVEPADAIRSNAYFSDRKANVFAYNANSPYAENLVHCVYDNSLSSSCTLAQTPLLAEEVNDSSATPSVASIMDRVLVSHQWMGDRFKDFLTNNDDNDDIKNLLRATTAIVIAYDIRPSFYWAATGAIYLDAENFWLSPQERDTINEAADFRADFGNDLQFVMPWRYIKDNAYASQSFSKSARVTRTATAALYRLTSLMYHELAHANDFFPSNEWYVHHSDQRVLDAALSTDFESDELALALPLASQEMRNLAQVSFAGETANSTQKNYLPTDIESFFSPDRATDYYAYSSKREDYAMLFEELMMQNRFGVIRDVAITNQPSGNNISAADYIVTWGQRGRIGDDKLTERVLFSASRVLAEFDSQAAINLVPAPITMVVGDSWLDNLTISPSEPNMDNLMKQLNGYAIPQPATEKASIAPVTETLENFNRYYQKPLPNH
ncbi:hypothetical protein CMT41_06770 [Colwellia sp. MT41]|uniref:Lipoprotein n=1 Tax=Colwellia marinimaniae TaxID=1513592 RepID=A0ABQ0MYU2_9GAMM|nr:MULTISPECIES: hypothetical protein [Colwellia]ALO34452.1 hypothetical protein CMT41_06770 [Colwellia sp. MT41]GAW97520.1 hypothetical protein MTCD1_03147 [Colwellia marinimaniae]